MTELLTALVMGIATFTATNLDDILILMLLFSQVNQAFRSWHIVTGQYLGFIVLVLVSLLGFLGSTIVPPSMIRLLGLLPLGIGLVCLLKNEAKEDSPDTLEIGLAEQQSPKTWSLWPIFPVSAITIANGGDNIAIYLPLFANSRLISLLVILGVFLVLVGVWCYVAYRLTHQPMIARLLTSYSKSLIPIVLIGLGVFIIKESIGSTILVLGICYIWSITFGQAEPKNSGVETN